MHVPETACSVEADPEGAPARFYSGYSLKRDYGTSRRGFLRKRSFEKKRRFYAVRKRAFLDKKRFLDLLIEIGASAKAHF